MDIVLRYGWILTVLATALVTQALAYPDFIMEKRCKTTEKIDLPLYGKNSQLIVKSQDSDLIYYKAGVTCLLYVTNKPDISGLVISLRTVSTQAENDTITFFRPFDGTRFTLSGNKYVNVESAKHSYILTTGELCIEWKTQPNPQNATLGLGFDMTVTAFKQGTTHCDEDEKLFFCKVTGRCIDRRWVCNGRNNCGQMEDEYSNLCSSRIPSALSVLLGIGISISLAFLTFYALAKGRKMYLRRRNARLLFDEYSGRLPLRPVTEGNFRRYSCPSDQLPTRRNTRAGSDSFRSRDNQSSNHPENGDDCTTQQHQRSDAVQTSSSPRSLLSNGVVLTKYRPSPKQDRVLLIKNCTQEEFASVNQVSDDDISSESSSGVASADDESDKKDSESNNDVLIRSDSKQTKQHKNLQKCAARLGDTDRTATLEGKIDAAASNSQNG